jgi:hypothetical protein
MQNAKYQLSDKWRHYLQYEPLLPDCSDAELQAFLSREDEAVCGMCPANPERIDIPSPLPQRREAKFSSRAGLDLVKGELSLDGGCH